MNKQQASSVLINAIENIEIAANYSDDFLVNKSESLMQTAREIRRVIDEYLNEQA
jgi:hypothetical protein